jgi:hypothetical protein
MYEISHRGKATPKFPFPIVNDYDYISAETQTKDLPKKVTELPNQK